MGDHLVDSGHGYDEFSCRRKPLIAIMVKRPPLNMQNAIFKFAFWAWFIWPIRVKGLFFFWQTLPAKTSDMQKKFEPVALRTVQSAVETQLCSILHSIKTLSWPSGVFFSHLFEQKMNTIGARNYHCLAYQSTMNKNSVPVKMEGPPPGS